MLKLQRSVMRKMIIKIVLFIVAFNYFYWK